MKNEYEIVTFLADKLVKFNEAYIKHNVSYRCASANYLDFVKTLITFLNNIVIDGEKAFHVLHAIEDKLYFLEQNVAADDASKLCFIHFLKEIRKFIEE